MYFCRLINPIPLKRIPLHDTHLALGAKMVPFAGYEMPVRYSSGVTEHLAVRESVGIFDVSHMGEFFVEGPGALALIQRLTANDAAKLHSGKVQYSALLNEQGGIVDDLLVYRLGADRYMLVVNAANIEKDWAWISRHNTQDVKLRNASDEYALFAVQGPKATATLQPLTDVDLAAMAYYSFQVAPFAGVADVIISATGYTGAGGYEIYVRNEAAKVVWDRIMEVGVAFGIQPVGLGARDTLRMEMGYCLYGNDISEETNPYEAGLGWITRPDKEGGCMAGEPLRAAKAAGVERKLVGFTMLDRGIPRSHYPIVDAAGEEIGEVTSGTQSPSLNVGIGMGYVQKAYAAPGTEFYIQIRDRNLKAQVTKLPFYQPAR